MTTAEDRDRLPSVAGTAGRAFLTSTDGIVTVTVEGLLTDNSVSALVVDTLQRAASVLAARNDLSCLVFRVVGSSGRAGDHSRLCAALEGMRKPTVLAVHGPCLDAGVEIALSCDFRFCTPPAVFAVPPGSGATKRLTRLVGPAWAKWMAMAGRQVDGTDAKRIGLVHDVFPVETFLDEVNAFCRNLGGFPAKPSAGPNQRTRLPLTRNVQISISGGGPAWTASRAARSPRMDTGMSSGPFEQRSADKPVDVSTARGRAPLPPGRRDAGPPGLAGLLGRYGATTETKL